MNREDILSAGGTRDLKYEFAAPKFHDFFDEDGEVPDDNADDWFSKIPPSILPPSCCCTLLLHLAAASPCCTLLLLLLLSFSFWCS